MFDLYEIFANSTNMHIKQQEHFDYRYFYIGSLCFIIKTLLCRLISSSAICLFRRLFFKKSSIGQEKIQQVSETNVKENGEKSANKTVSLKHKAFVSEPLGDKDITSLAGIGECIGRRLTEEGIDKVSNIIFYHFNNHF